MPLFATLDVTAINREIAKARQHVILAAAGITRETATALIEARQRLGPGNVQVVLDASAGVARLGFGDHEAVEALMAAHFAVGNHPGLRIGVLICDDYGWSFAGTPRLVEAAPNTSGAAFNAIALTQAQVIALRGELPQIGRATSPEHPRPASAVDRNTEAGGIMPLVGAESLTHATLTKVTRALEIAAPKPFDLARRSNVYAALIQFVELSFEGFNIQARRIQLPKTLPMIASKDKALKERLTASLKLLDKVEKPASLTSVTDALEELRATYLRPVGKAGRVMLKAKRSCFVAELRKIESDLANCKESLVGDLQKALDGVIQSIAPELARAVMTDPPPRFRGLFPATEESANDFVREELGKAFPDAAELVQGMKIHCLFKDVTYEMLTDKAFRDAVLTQIPKSVVDGALLTEEEMAASPGEPGNEGREPWGL
jgi:hypothetical protein